MHDPSVADGDKVTVSITRQDGSGDALHFEFDGPGEYRLFCFDADGKVRPYGGLPWKKMKAPLGRWAKEWAAGQNPAALLDGRDDRQAGSAGEELLASLDGADAEAALALQAGQGNREGHVALMVAKELLRAVARRLAGVGRRPVTRWEFEEGEAGGAAGVRAGVLAWLFRRE